MNCVELCTGTDLGVILAGEGSTSVCAPPAIGVNNNLKV
jgi:hypothetical protein